MKTTITLCDLCHSPLVGPGFKKPIHGVCLNLGYSTGGWGSRRNNVDWSGEVCEKCYEEYEAIAKAVAKWIEKREGVRAPEIIVREHSVSCVWTDEPSPDGRERALLR